MLQSELILRIASKIGKYTCLEDKDVKNAVDLIVDTLREETAKGRRVEIRDFGAFSYSSNPMVRKFNPRKREFFYAPRAKVSFRAGKELRERVNNKP